MCGIVGAACARNSTAFLVKGLKTLEYRGYDSAGLAMLASEPTSGLKRARALGRVSELEVLVAREALSGQVGIAHTRWATHGAPAEHNAHPHVSGELAVVHNGIIENYESLKAQLQTLGYVFTSDTDTETIAHLVHACLAGHAEFAKAPGEPAPDLFAAVRQAVTFLEGAYALAVIHEAAPDTLVVAREGSPLMLGLGEEGNYAASDASALLPVTRRMVYLENGDVARLTRDNIEIVDRLGQPVEREVVVSTLSADSVELGDYRHYMQKEIFEQPQALANTLEMLGSASSLQPGIFGADAKSIFEQIDSVLILACGTSYYAGLTARYWLEEVAGIPCNTEIASEYRYRNSVPHGNQLVVVISQSGETADTLAALRHAKALGHRFTLSICNMPESAIVRETALRFITRAGLEIGVASTKAFTTQLGALFLLTLLLAKDRGRLTRQREQVCLEDLRHLPVAVSKVLALEPDIEIWAQRFAQKRHALFLGRGHHYPIALEGALKLKEISYIHAEAYPAGELKHGPLALVDAEMPVVVIAPNDALIDKLKANMQEVSARGGELYVFADGDSRVTESEGVNVLKLPEHYGLLSPLLHVVALQLLAYHVALVKGTDVDKPRNLAKSVTVE